MTSKAKLPKPNLKIVCGSFKGGVGKSTIAINLGVYLRHQGLSVGFIDSDRQRSVSKFIEKREEMGMEPQFVCIERLGNNKSTIESYSQNYDVTVIDVAGHDSKEMRSALLTADILISPLGPTQFDIDTLDQLNQTIEEVKDYNPNLRAFMLINRTHQVRFKKTEYTKKLLEQVENLEVLDRAICELIVYGDSPAIGLSAWEMGLVTPRLISKDAEQERKRDMEELWEELNQKFALPPKQPVEQ